MHTQVECIVCNCTLSNCKQGLHSLSKWTACACSSLMCSTSWLTTLQHKLDTKLHSCLFCHRPLAVLLPIPFAGGVPHKFGLCSHLCCTVTTLWLHQPQASTLLCGGELVQRTLDRCFVSPELQRPISSTTVASIPVQTWLAQNWTRLPASCINGQIPSSRPGEKRNFSTV